MSHNAEKKLKGGTLRDFSTSIMSENIKKLKGGPFGEKFLFSKKSLIEPKNTLREYPSALLSFLDGRKIIKLRNANNLSNLGVKIPQVEIPED